MGGGAENNSRGPGMNDEAGVMSLPETGNRRVGGGYVQAEGRTAEP